MAAAALIIDAARCVVCVCVCMCVCVWMDGLRRNFKKYIPPLKIKRYEYSILHSALFFEIYVNKTIVGMYGVDAASKRQSLPNEKTSMLLIYIVPIKRYTYLGLACGCVNGIKKIK